MTDHLGELAALYALGALDAREAADADEHLARCEACRRLLAQAQTDLTAMELLRPEVEPPAQLRGRIQRSLTASPRKPLRRAGLAIAAAILVAVLPAGYLVQQNLAMHQSMLVESEAMARVASSPHRTVAFAGTDARVMYAPDGSWYCVVIRGASTPLHVVWPHDGQQTMLGTAVPHGNVALLYLPKSHPMRTLSLMLDGRVVGQAQLVF
jgi:anti-sigma factor RsiW